MRGIAYRRHRREVMKARAASVLRRLFSDENPNVLSGYWADNISKCSCHLCKGEKKLGLPTVSELRQRETMKVEV